MEHTIKYVRPDDSGELLPCPFCGNDDVVYEQYEHSVGPRWRVVCCACMAMVDPGYAQNKYQVRDMWNRRQGGRNE